MTRPAPWFPADRGQKLAAHRTTRAAVDAALEGLQLAGTALVTADLARSAADLVDAARRAQDPKLWLSASTRLELLVAKLSAAGVRAGGHDDDRGEDETSGGVEQVGDDPAAELAAIVGRAPDVGDGTESA